MNKYECINLNDEEFKSVKSSYSGYAFKQTNTARESVLDIGKFDKGRFDYGIKYFKQEKVMQMGVFDGNLQSGLKYFANGDTCICWNFQNVNGYGLIGAGRSLYIYSDGSWVYGDILDGENEGDGIFYHVLTDSVYYMRFKNGVSVAEMKLPTSGFKFSLRANYPGDKTIFFDGNLDVEKFDKEIIDGVVTYKTDYFVKNGLGYYRYPEGLFIMGEFRDKGLDGYKFDENNEFVSFSYWDKGYQTEATLQIYNNGLLCYGHFNKQTPRFSFHTNGDFSVGNSKHRLYVDENFNITVEEYDERTWVKTLKEFTINATPTNNTSFKRVEKKSGGGDGNIDYNSIDNSNTYNNNQDLYKDDSCDNQDNSSSSSSTNTKKTTTTKRTSLTKSSSKTKSSSDGKSGEEELNELIGLEEVKRQLRRIKAYLAKNKGRKLNLHMVFTGCPGTGKTIVARLVGKILYESGVLPTNNFVEASRETLIGEYIGHTAVKTKKAIESAMGGVLFIDEAYSLHSSAERDFGHEAVAELLKKMEDCRGDFCCIMAGYTKEMGDFINMNPGFKSRVQFFIDFPNYNKEEMKQITKIFFKSNELTGSDEVIDKIVEIVRLKEKQKNFANAREIRSLVDKLAMIQSERTLDDLDDREITIDDVNQYIEENNIDFTEQKKVAMIDYFELKGINRINTPECYEDVKQTILESVVSIKVESEDGAGEGSGFVISKDGYMVSAAHVVNFTKPKISVRRRVLDRYLNEVDVYYDANIVALDSENDIAILKINVKGEIPHLYLPEEGSSDLDLSSRIAILGYPFGVSRFDNVSITEGKIASYQNVGLKRVINLACEAKVGNSGSCVIDLSSGLCIGVLIGAHLKDREEINYCAPIDYVWKLVRKYQA